MGPKRIAIIGAGATGLCCIKSLKEESLEPVCFEKTNNIAGLWHYHTDVLEGVASVMSSTIINSSKEISALSDFPPKAESPNYMHNTLICEWFKEYAEKFDLERHIRFQKEVMKVDMAEDYDETGRLTVVYRDIKTKEIAEETFDGVMVCIGHHQYPNMPSFPGMEKFKGKIMHTHGLKNVDGFEGQNVVVIGIGNSGLDAAVELSSVAKQVYLSTRKGAWIVPRVGPNGWPFDLAVLRRFICLFLYHLPYSFISWASENTINTKFDHDMYGLKPAHRIWSQHITVSDTLPVKLLSGTVKIKKNVLEFEQNGVLFDGEQAVTECDSVVLATGYQIKFPFLDEKLTTVRNNEVHLYKYAYPPHMKHPTLVILGLFQPIGALFPLSEAQARWASLLFNGKLKLPSLKAMEADIRKKKLFNQKRYNKSERHTVQVDYISYLDEIYSIFGAKPNLIKMFFTDPVLFWNLLFGPSLPYQYRLQGPHPWPGARKTLLEWRKRVIMPLGTGYNANSPHNVITSSSYVQQIITLSVVITAIVVAFLALMIGLLF